VLECIIARKIHAGQGHRPADAKILCVAVAAAAALALGQFICRGIDA